MVRVKKPEKMSIYDLLFDRPPNRPATKSASPVNRPATRSSSPANQRRNLDAVEALLSMMRTPTAYESSSSDALLSLRRSPPRPPPVENHYFVDKLLKMKTEGRKRWFLVKWTGYAKPTWEPESHVEQLAAYRAFMASKRV